MLAPLYGAYQATKEGNYDMKDRSYYRQCDVTQLLEEAKYGDSELAIALAERLKDALFQIEHADNHEIATLEGQLDELKEELTEAENTIRYLENELENAK